MVRIFNPLKDDRPLQEMKHGRAVVCVRYSPDGKRLLSAGETGPVGIWDLATETRTAQIPAGMSGMKDARFSPDGEQVAVALGNGTVQIRDIDTQSLVQTLPSTIELRSLAFSDDGQTIVTGGNFGQVKMWSVSDGKLQHTYETTWRIGDLEFVKDSRVLTIASVNGDLHFYDVDAQHDAVQAQDAHAFDGRVCRAPPTASGWRSAAAMAPSSWCALGKMRPNVLWQDDAMRSLAFLPDGKRLVAAGGRGSLKIWDVETGQSQQLRPAGDQPCRACRLQPGGKLVAVGGAKQPVALWDLDRPKTHRADRSCRRLA